MLEHRKHHLNSKGQEAPLLATTAAMAAATRASPSFLMEGSASLRTKGHISITKVKTNAV